jgi:hypothetical protein
MTRKDQIARIVQDHHDAFLVEVLGPLGCGLAPERIAELRQKGLVTKQGLDTHGGAVPTGGTVDPFMFLRGIGKYLAEHPEKYDELKKDPDSKWVDKVSEVLADLKQEDLRVPGMHHVEEAVHMDDEGHVEISPEIPVPRNKPVPADYGEKVPQEKGLVPVRAEWKGASPMDVAAYRQALTRAGEFCRGLGNIWSEELGHVAMEKWDGERIVSTPDPALREESLRRIRRTVAEAWKDKKPAKTLASDLARETGDYTRNWDRIARTELQAAYNDGVAIDAVQAFGKKAQVARIPERRACSACKRLFLDATGNPVVWDVAEIAKNGTNVGRKRSEWQATLFPVHPKCMCGTMIVPPGMYVLPTGRLVRRKA